MRSLTSPPSAPIPGWLEKLRSCRVSSGALFRRLGGLEQALAGLAVAVDGMFDQIEIAQYDSEQVVEVMRQPAGELADGFHLLRLLQLRARPGGGWWCRRSAPQGDRFRPPSLRTSEDAGERPGLGLLAGDIAQLHLQGGCLTLDEPAHGGKKRRLVVGVDALVEGDADELLVAAS